MKRHDIKKNAGIKKRHCMKIYLDCYPCFLRQALSAARLAGGDAVQQREIVQQTLALLQGLKPGATPPEIARKVHAMVRSHISAADPYQEVKSAGTRAALALYPRLKTVIDESVDPLGTALRISIAGNIMDFGVADRHDDLWQTVERVLAQPMAIDHEHRLRERLSEADHLLFLADNAGETVFDRLLIEVMPVPVIYAVKGSPTLNDATMQDALDAGLEGVARLVDNGSDAPGTILSLCSDAFVDLYRAAPLVIAKGQANYETLSEAGPKVFCLLQVKCPVIAEDIGAPTGSVVIRQG